jgi:hypothetical protein
LGVFGHVRILNILDNVNIVRREIFVRNFLPLGSQKHLDDKPGASARVVLWPDGSSIGFDGRASEREDATLEALCSWADPDEAAYLRKERASILEHDGRLCSCEAELRAGIHTLIIPIAWFWHRPERHRRRHDEP